MTTAIEGAITNESIKSRSVFSFSNLQRRNLPNAAVRRSAWFGLHQRTAWCSRMTRGRLAEVGSFLQGFITDVISRVTWIENNVSYDLYLITDLTWHPYIFKISGSPLILFESGYFQFLLQMTRSTKLLYYMVCVDDIRTVMIEFIGNVYKK